MKNANLQSFITPTGWGIVKIGHKNEAETRLRTRTAMHCMVSQSVELSQHPLPKFLL